MMKHASSVLFWLKYNEYLINACKLLKASNASLDCIPLWGCFPITSHLVNMESALVFQELEKTMIHLWLKLHLLHSNTVRVGIVLHVFLLHMVMGSEGEGGTQMHSVKKIDLMGQAEQTEVISQVIIYIKVQRQKARELSVRTRKEGQNQKVNVTINTTWRPNINNSQDEINTGWRSNKMKNEKTNIHRWKANTNTKITEHGQEHGKQMETGNKN